MAIADKGDDQEANGNVRPGRARAANG